MGVEPREALITDEADVLGPVIERLEEADVKVHVLEPGKTPLEAAYRGGEVPVLIIGFMPFGPEEISELRNTGLLIRAGIGYDGIDLQAASTEGIWVANVPDFCSEEVADHTMMFLLAAMRQLPHAMSTWRTERSWQVTAQLPSMHRLSGKRIGLVGLGRIGRLVARRALSFGCEVVAFDPKVSEEDFHRAGVASVSLQDLVSTSHIVSLHCPLTPESHHLVNAELLALARPGVVILNTSRGGLIDLDALDQAMRSNVVSYAAMDVLDGEPDPDLEHPLLSLPNVMVTSHTAWRSVEASSQLTRNIADEAIRFLDGEQPLNLLNPEVRPL